MGTNAKCGISVVRSMIFKKQRAENTDKDGAQLRQENLEQAWVLSGPPLKISPSGGGIRLIVRIESPNTWFHLTFLCQR